jgi:hypothetical protein
MICPGSDEIAPRFALSQRVPSVIAGGDCLDGPLVMAGVALPGHKREAPTCARASVLGGQDGEARRPRRFSVS